MMIKDLKTVKKIIDKLAYILSPKQKKGALLVFFSIILCSMLEMLGVSAIYPFLDYMMNTELASEKWYVKFILDMVPGITISGVLVVLSILIIIVYIVKNAVSLLCSYILYKFSARLKRELSTLMLESYLRRPYEFFVNHSSAEITRGINGDTTHTYQIMQDIFEFLSAFLTALMIGVYLLLTDWFIATAAIVLALVCFLLIVLGFKKKMKKAGAEYLDASTKQYKYSFQAVNGIKEITVMDRRDSFIRQYESAAKEYERASVVNSFISACPDRIIEGVCIGGFVGIACLRFVFGSDLGTFIPVLGSFAIGAFKILPSISKMSTRINSIVYQQHFLYSCYDNISEARELVKQEKNNSLENDKDCSEVFKFQNELKLSNVTWKYQNSAKNILDDLSLKIAKGEAVALIGASGAGKTTLADIILGLFCPQQGSVEMDGKDIFRIPHAWAKTVGYVPQTVFLIDDTIRANIAFGLPMELVDDRKIWKALEQAQLLEFVQSLPKKLDTEVGERGVKFSGGQRQRVAIARALYEDPEIMILDEATSALDTETETAVMESIDALMGHKTMIIIAHRISTIRNCDRVYEIKDGKAIERQKTDVISQELMK